MLLLLNAKFGAFYQTGGDFGNRVGRIQEFLDQNPIDQSFLGLDSNRTRNILNEIF